MLKWILTLTLGVSGLSKLDQLVLESRAPLKISKIQISNEKEVKEVFPVVEEVQSNMNEIEVEDTELVSDVSEQLLLFKPAVELASISQEKLPVNQERDWVELIEKSNADTVSTSQSAAMISANENIKEEMVIYDYQNQNDTKEEKRFSPINTVASNPIITGNNIQENGFWNGESSDEEAESDLIKLYAFGVNDKGLMGKNLSQIDLTFLDSDERLFDHGAGYISLANFENRKFYLYRTDYVRTVTQVKPNELSEQFVPLFTEKYFKRLAGSKYKEEASLLIRLDDTTEDVLVNANSKVLKYYLSSELKIVDRQTDAYEYVLFIRLNPGNHVINYVRVDNTYIQKIMYLGISELTYEDNGYEHETSDKFRLVEQNLMGRKAIQLNIRSTEIKLFSSNIFPRKEGLNDYIYDDLFTPHGVRRYYELAHLTFNLYMGREKHRKVEIPDEQYVSEVMRNFNINKLEGRCLVQFNFSKHLKEYTLNAMNDGHSMYTEELLLGRDGVFYDLVLENTEKLFVLGDKPGVMNIKFEFLDNTSQYVESFCSSDAYLVEQI
jgi:hypothetical protein